MSEYIININKLKKDEIKENPQMSSNITQSNSFQYCGVL